MTRTVTVDAAQARDLSAGGAFVADRDLALDEVCELVVRGPRAELRVSARVVYVDPARGTGLEVIGFCAELRDKIAALSERATPVPIAARARAEADETNVHARIRGMNLAQQIKLAHEGDLQERMILERLYGKNVWEALLRNPRLTAPEVTRIARNGTLPRILVDAIVNNATWLQMPDVRRALLLNPRLGADQIVRILRLMPKPELRLVPTMTVLPLAVRETAKRLLRGEGA